MQSAARGAGVDDDAPPVCREYMLVIEVEGSRLGSCWAKRTLFAHCELDGTRWKGGGCVDSKSRLSKDRDKR